MTRNPRNPKSHLRWLETYGQVPDDADHIDWQLAQQTTWWGRRLDSDQFWTNRVVWLSATNQMDARRRGRMYPPIPLGYAAETKHEDDIPVGTGWSVEGPNIAFRVSNSEAAFWSGFARTHPRPPEDIERQQLLGSPPQTISTPFNIAPPPQDSFGQIQLSPRISPRNRRTPPMHGKSSICAA